MKQVNGFVRVLFISDTEASTPSYVSLPLISLEDNICWLFSRSLIPIQIFTREKYFNLCRLTSFQCGVM